MTGKTLWQSKTFWVNIIGAIAFFLAAQFNYQVTPQETAILLAAVNMLLRAITKEEILW